MYLLNLLLKAPPSDIIKYLQSNLVTEERGCHIPLYTMDLLLYTPGLPPSPLLQFSILPLYNTRGAQPPPPPPKHMCNVLLQFCFSLIFFFSNSRFTPHPVFHLYIFAFPFAIHLKHHPLPPVLKASFSISGAEGHLLYCTLELMYHFIMTITCRYIYFIGTLHNNVFLVLLCG